MILLSITGLFRTILIILGVFFLLQIIGKTAQARRNIAEQQRMHKEAHESKKRAEQARNSFGKTSISKIDKNNIDESEYAEYEEVE